MGVYLGNECVSVSSGIPSSSGLPDTAEKLMNYIQENGTKITDTTTGCKGLGYYYVIINVVPDSSYADNPFMLKGVVVKYTGSYINTTYATSVYFPDAGENIDGSFEISHKGQLIAGATLGSLDAETAGFESVTATCYYLPFSS